MSKPYHRKFEYSGWFMKRPGYMMFMVREMTAVCVGIYIFILLKFLLALLDGPASFANVLAQFNGAGWKFLHVIAFIGAAWHAITWFNVTPKAMPVFIGEKKAPAPAVAIGMGYGPWVAVSIFIMWLVCP